MTSPYSVANQRLKGVRRSPSKPVSPARFSSAYLVGICGSGMKALAELLVGLGWKITGSDTCEPNPTLRAMQERGLRVHSGHDDLYLPSDFDVLVYSPAVGPDNPERRAAVQRGICQMSYSQMLGHLMRDRIGVSIAGTHGKSTTTAMAATILSDSNLSASAVVGAELCGRNKSGWAGTGEHLVVESCEYQRSFLDIRPRLAAILSIEPDHFDCYTTFDEMRAAFARYAEQVEDGGVLLIPSRCSLSAEAARGTQAELVTFSDQPGADWWATDPRATATGTRFRVFFRGDYFSEINLAVPGRHNVLNALAAIAVSHHAGASADEVRTSLQGFVGIRRRFERLGSWRGVTLIDDYAHHPTAIRATLETAREIFGRRRIWCAFQPHQVSRTQTLLNEFSQSFELADEILVLPVYAARENLRDEPTMVSQELASRAGIEGRSARFCGSLDRVVTTLEDEARPGDVLITMGAGDIDQVQHEFARRLQRHRAAG